MSWYRIIAMAGEWHREVEGSGNHVVRVGDELLVKWTSDQQPFN